MSETARFNRAMRALLLLSALLPLLLFAVVGWHERGERLREAAAHVAQTLRMLEEHALRVFEAQRLIIDAVDRQIVGMDWNEIRASEGVHHLLREAAGSSPHVDGLWLVPPDGLTANSADFFPFPLTDVSDREYFKVLSAEDRLHYGKMMIGRAKGNLNFNLSRRRSGAEGFDGLILVTASVSYFTDFWSDASDWAGIGDASSAVAGLFRTDGEILARMPALEGLPNRLPDTSPLMRAVHGAGPDTVYRSISTIDGVERIYGFSRVGDTPLIIGFGIDEGAVLAGWRRDLLWQAMAALSASALLALASVVVLRQRDSLGLAARSWRETAEALRLEVDRRVRAEDVAAERDRLIARLRHATQERQALLDTMVEGVAAFDAEGRVVYCNEAARRILRLCPDAAPAFDRMAAEDRLTTPDGAPVAAEATPVARLLAGETLRTEEFALHFPGEDAPTHCSFLGAPLRDDAQRVTGAVLTFWDVTRQKLEEERRALLTRELDHRVRNMLATIMAIVRMSSAGAASVDALVESLMGRVEAMARTHGFISRSGWQGVDLARIVADEVRPYAGEGRVQIIGGPPAWLPPKEAVDLALVVHELATNAVKHGAWSAGAGTVEIGWRREPGPAPMLRVTWRERGGPPIAADPARRGFGARLIGAAFRDAGAGVTLRFPPVGAVCEILVPLRPAAEPGLAPPPPPPPEAAPGALDGLRVLVAEDEPLVALDVVAMLEATGVAVVAVAGTLAEAAALARDGDFDAALLDINLNSESIGPVAETLRARGVHVVFATGYDDVAMLPASLRGLARLQKPISAASAVAALAAGRRPAAVAAV